MVVRTWFVMPSRIYLYNSDTVKLGQDCKVSTLFLTVICVRICQRIPPLLTLSYVSKYNNRSVLHFSLREWEILLIGTRVSQHYTSILYIALSLQFHKSGALSVNFCKYPKCLRVRFVIIIRTNLRDRLRVWLLWHLPQATPVSAANLRAVSKH